MNRRSILAGSVALGYRMTAGAEPQSLTGTSHLVILPAAQQMGQLSLCHAALKT